jgi:predicted MFS family arabinose efflux permease
MEQLLPVPAETRGEKDTPLWKNPGAWLREKELSREFWGFFTAAFFFDFGFAIYVFLFNLYLLDMHFNERAMGLIGGAMTLGSVAGTLPAGLVARKIGLRPVLIVCFVATPALCSLRVMKIGEPAQIGLAFFSGVAMCLYGVCFLPVIARFTIEKNRATAFSLIFSASIGTAALGGVVCGYLPRWLGMAGFVMRPDEVKRLILLTSCGIAALGLVAVLRMRLPLSDPEQGSERAQGRRPKMPPFLLLFLPAMALWTAVLASFTPFANVYLSRDLHVSLARIGLIFSIAQILQFCMGLLTPLLFRSLGLVRGVVVTQLLTAVAVGGLAATHDGRLAIVLYLFFSAMQWMSAPGLYNLLMSETPDEERSTASAATMFCNALVSSGATAGAGILFARFGYPPVLTGIAALAVMVAMLFWTMAGQTGQRAGQRDSEVLPHA